jgi:hypothetical protein
MIDLTDSNVRLAIRTLKEIKEETEQEANKSGKSKNLLLSCFTCLFLIGLKVIKRKNN